MAEYIERGGMYFPTPFSTEEKGDYRQGWNHCLRAIYQQPIADVVTVRHGRWISDSPGKRFGTVVRLDKDGCPVDTCHCSECGEWLTASDEYPVIGYYCPNCGAKMDGGQEEAPAGPYDLLYEEGGANTT